MDPLREALFRTAQFQLQRRPRLQHTGSRGHVMIEPGQLLEDRETGQPMMTARLNLTWDSFYMFGELPDELLRALHDMIGRFIGIPQPPVQVQVQLSEPRRRRRRAPPEVVAAVMSTDFDAEKEAIKRRMLEGK